MCSLENAFNSFITDETHKEMLNKYEIQDKLLKDEYIITKDALLNKYNVDLDKITYSHSDYINKIFASVYKDKKTNKLYYKYINKNEDVDDEFKTKIEPYIWLDEEAWNKLIESETNKINLEKMEQDNKRPDLLEWIIQNPGKLKGNKLEIYENSNSEPKYVCVSFNNNDIWYDVDYNYIRFRNNPSREAIRMALLDGPIAHIICEEDEEIDVYYSETPKNVLDKYL
jgi:hypothetical protein